MFIKEKQRSLGGENREVGEKERDAGKEKKRGWNFIKNLTQFDMWAPHVGVKF